MPYIPQEQRDIIDPAIGPLVEAIKKATVYTGTAFKDVPPDGALNYTITRLLQGLLVPSTPSYLLLERATGLLECCKLEFYRRTAAPYENKKAKENGDVFEWQEGGQLK
jgi:hypothetical protein